MNDDAVYDIFDEEGSEPTLSGGFFEHQIRAIIWPSRWRSVDIEKVPEWTEVKFGSDTAKCVPKTPGIYALCIAIDCDVALKNVVVAYIGKSETSLRDRFRNYLSEQKRGSRRNHIRRLFKHWGSDLYFSYWSISDTSCDLNKIEITLNDAIVPPFVTNDFSASVRKEVNMFRVR